MPQLTVAKASKKDIQSTNDFLNICDSIWGKWGDGAESWKEWDQEEEDYKLCLRIQKDIMSEYRYFRPESVDDTLIMFEFLRQKFMACRCRYGRVIMAADSLIEAACDPTERHLAFHPGFDFFHVAPEQ